jgi:hypothetical protein
VVSVRPAFAIVVGILGLGGVAACGTLLELGSDDGASTEGGVMADGPPDERDAADRPSDAASHDAGDGAGDAGCTSTIDTATDPLNCGACGRKCNAKGTCDAGVCSRRVVFVTSVTFTGGAFGGTLAADGRCTQLANAAGLGGSFRAWLSLGGNNSRFSQPSFIPYFNTKADHVADSWPPGITTLSAAIAYDENAIAPPVSTVWTNLDRSGNASSDNCLDWGSSDSLYKGEIGKAGVMDSTWAASGATASCNAMNALYCVEWP